MLAPVPASIVAVESSAWEETDTHGVKAHWKLLVTLTCKNQVSISEGPGS